MLRRIILFSCATFFLGIQMCLASPFDLPLKEHKDIENFVKKQNDLIKNEKENAQNFVLRGDAYFLLGEFDKAVEDYNQALQKDAKQIEAYLGKGLALARSGWIEEGIAELDVYLKLNPKSSLAYTKRGVRRLWLGESEAAQKDFEKALELDPANAEAHDDLGVILARKNMIYEAADHFISAIEFDPTYQKAYHNLALISYMTEKDELALTFVNSSLSLNPYARDSLMLKAQILGALGYAKEAQKIQEEAEFLPEGNWSEHVPLQ